ncbi:MAG: protein phosphatase CheZ [Magnetovibrio sp.]|nr:protein phosphatase CheZ [Magnetovibrio sp.]
MAGRKSKTATAGKAKVKAEAGSVGANPTGTKSPGVKSRVGKSAAKSPATKNPATMSKGARSAKGGASKVKAAKLKAVDQVVAAAKAVRKSSTKKASKKAGPQTAYVYAELEQLAAYIDAARREIAHIRPHDVKDEYLPDAADELNAVVEATADATNAIMDSCDAIEAVMGEVSAETSSKLMDATTRIYEACTFQDITGQRIGKVVTALQNIEERIDALLHTLGDEQIIPKAKSTTKPKTKSKIENNKVITDADLLEGPQLGDKAKSQAEIDALLASFD